MSLFFAALLGWVFPCVIAVLAAWEDGQRLQLSNRHALVLLIGFPLAAVAVPYLSFVSGLCAAVLVLVPGLVLYAVGMMGAGDIKLAVVFALYLGVGWLGRFVVGACLMGGVLGLVAVCVRHYQSPLASDSAPRHWIDRIRQGGRDLPYGIALAVPFIALLTERFAHAYAAFKLG